MRKVLASILLVAAALVASENWVAEAPRSVTIQTAKKSVVMFIEKIVFAKS